MTLPKGAPAPNPPARPSHGVFKLHGKPHVLIGEHLHEVKGANRDRFGGKLVQISKFGRPLAGEEFVAVARLARVVYEEAKDG